MKTRENYANTLSENKKYNLGICIIKIWMSFEVVVAHYMLWDGVPLNCFNIIRLYVPTAVPIFMIMTFFLSDMTTIINENKLWNRLHRLIVPHLFWTVVYYVVYRYFTIYYKKVYIYSRWDIVWQIMMGSSYNGTAWFQPVLIVLTLFFSIIFFFLKRKGYAVLIIIGVLALFLQYGGFVFRELESISWPSVFGGGHFEPRYVKFTVGRLVEMIPYAAIGTIMRKLLYKRNNSILTKVVSMFFVILSWLFLRYELIPNCSGYGYQGLNLLVASVALFLFFYFFPFEKFLKSDNYGMYTVITYLSDRTMAIYFMHRLVGECLYTTNAYQYFGMQRETLYDCLIIWIFSLIISVLLRRMPIKVVRDSV